MTLHNVNILMSLNLTPKSDKFYVCFSTKEETRTRKTGSRTACTPALSVPRGPSVSAKTTRGPLRTNIGHSAPTGVALTGLCRGNVSLPSGVLSGTSWDWTRRAGPGRALCRGPREGGVAGQGARGRQGSAGTTPSTLDSNTGHVRARGAQPDSSGLKHAHFFLPWFREGRGREKEGINVNSYGGKLIFFSRSKNLIPTVSFLRPSHSYQRLVH